MRFDPELYPWISSAAIAWGLLDCFLGYRLFKVTVAVLGGFLGATAANLAATALGLGHVAILTAMAVGLLIGAALAFLLYLGAVFLTGCGFGAVLGILLLAHWSQVAAVLGGCVLGVVCGFLALKLQRTLIILSTSLLGAFRAALALTFFTDRMDWAYYLRQPEQIPALLEGNGWMLPAIVALATIGTIVQFQILSRKKRGDRD